MATIEPGMVDTELPDHVTDPAASRLMADLIDRIDVLSPEDVAEAVAFMSAVPEHVDLTEITILPTGPPPLLRSWETSAAAVARSGSGPAR
ncbi:hypothetical protein ACIBF1_19260 [Spirillospora sp. NPDC050679]